MVCKVQIYEKPVLNDPVLIEGLPGIGFVANITALQIIKELNAKLFAQIQSSAFQDEPESRSRADNGREP